MFQSPVELKNFGLLHVSGGACGYATKMYEKRKAANSEMNVYGKKERSFIVLIRMSKNGLVLKRKCHLNIQLSDVVCVIFL